MTGCNEDALSGRTQRPSEVVDFRATDRVPPALHLCLHMRPGEEIILLVHIRIHIDSTIRRGSGDGNFHESTSLEYELNEVLEVKRRELEQPHSHGFNRNRRRSFCLTNVLGKRLDLALQIF